MRTNALGGKSGNKLGESESLAQLSADDPSKEYGKITEKSSPPESSQASEELQHGRDKDRREEDEAAEISLSASKSRSRSGKQQVFYKAKNRGGKSNKARLSANKRINDETINLELENGQFKTEIAQLSRQRKLRKTTKDCSRNICSRPHQTEQNLSIFNKKHMEIILQRNLRLNIKTKDAAMQTDPNRLQEMMQGVESESYEKSIERYEKQMKKQAEKGHSLSQWLKK